MARPRKDDTSPRLVPRAIRLPSGLDQAVEDYATAMRKRTTYGMPVTWSDALRELVTRGLEAVEAERPKAVKTKTPKTAKARKKVRTAAELALRRVMRDKR